MTPEIAVNSINWILDHVPENTERIDFILSGGEPLLEFELIKEIFDYVRGRKISIPYIFMASTNGTILTDEMKTWFTKYRDIFRLVLCLDGNKETHNINRDNSFDKIDIDFFVRNWPNQGIKVTISEYTLGHFAENIKFLHSAGFKSIEGVNFAENGTNWDREENIKILIPQLKELADFYLSNEEYHLNQMFDRRIDCCETNSKEYKKWCNIGTGTPFFDIDGSIYPCSFVTPMSFNKDELHNILQTDFTDDRNFTDDECINECYIYPICPTCAAANYRMNKSFKKRNKSKCRMQKLITLHIADYQARKIRRKPIDYDKAVLYFTIEAIKKIRDLYLDDFKEYP